MRRSTAPAGWRMTPFATADGAVAAGPIHLATARRYGAGGSEAISRSSSPTPVPWSRKRPLGLPTWSEKLLQEVLRLILEAYYEPRFSDRSHGFRPGRGCHTALLEVYHQWRGTVWFVEGDITDCLEACSHCSFR